MSPTATRGDGKTIPPGAGVVPVLKEIDKGRLKVVGTAFFVTRYGLFATAKHVLEDLVSDRTARRIGTAFILELVTDTEYLIRQITSVSLSTFTDVAIGLAGPQPGDKHANLVTRLSFDAPEPAERLTSFAYPENELMDFRDSTSTPELKSDYFVGSFVDHVSDDSNPFIPHHHFSTSVEIRSGASGCPVFNSKGRVIGIASRGWDFRGGPHQEQPLSSVLPASLLLPLEIDSARVPADSWEYARIPTSRRGAQLTFGELVAYGHVNVGTRHIT